MKPEARSNEELKEELRIRAVAEEFAEERRVKLAARQAQRMARVVVEVKGKKGRLE
jgi:hypothetical protein